MHCFDEVLCDPYHAADHIESEVFSPEELKCRRGHAKKKVQGRTRARRAGRKG